MQDLGQGCLGDDTIHKRDTVGLPVFEVGVDQLLVLLMVLNGEVQQVERESQFLLAVEHLEQRFLGRTLFGKALDGLDHKTQYDIGIDGPVRFIQYYLHFLQGVV